MSGLILPGYLNTLLEYESRKVCLREMWVKCEWCDREWCYRRCWTCLIIFGSDFNRFHEVLFNVFACCFKSKPMGLRWKWPKSGGFVYWRDDFAVLSFSLPWCVSDISPSPEEWGLHLWVKGKGECPLCTSYFVLNAILNTTTVAIKIMRYIKDTCFK